jgi:hypothetical protein
MAIVVKKYFQTFYRKKIHLLIQLEGFGWSNLIGIDVNRENSVVLLLSILPHSKSIVSIDLNQSKFILFSFTDQISFLD